MAGLKATYAQALQRWTRGGDLRGDKETGTVKKQGTLVMTGVQLRQRAVIAQAAIAYVVC